MGLHIVVDAVLRCHLGLRFGDKMVGLILGIVDGCCDGQNPFSVLGVLMLVVFIG